MSKSLVLTMTPQLGLTSQNPSAYYWRPYGLTCKAHKLTFKEYTL